MADLPIDSAGELAAQLSGNGVRATVQVFPNTAVDDTGTAAPVRTIEQTQGTPVGGPFDRPGAGAGRDDTGGPTSNSTQQMINDAFNGPIKPQPNILDKYASYTYQLSWYLLTPDQFEGLSKKTSRINTNDWQLLVQSGGAPTTTTGPYSNFTRNTTTGRSQYFPYDYYLDGLVLTNSLLGKGTNSAVNLLDIQFKVTEPNGITLVNNLYEAVSNLYKSAGITDTASYQVAQYVMGIRFYGYDDQGNLVQGNNGGMGDPSAIVEKYYPFRLTGLTFRMANRVIEYTCTGTPINYVVGSSSQRGTIPHNFALAGQTLDELFNGKQGNSADQVSNEDGRKDSSNVNSSNMWKSRSGPIDSTTLADNQSSFTTDA